MSGISGLVFLGGWNWTLSIVPRAKCTDRIHIISIHTCNLRKVQNEVEITPAFECPGTMHWSLDWMGNLFPAFRNYRE